MFLRRAAAVCVSQHNKIQFLGYELANAVFLGKSFFSTAGLDSHASIEVCAVLAFIAGSACIWFYHPIRQTTMLFYGGVGLTIGGLCLTLAGYPVTGLSVMLASLETTRGGIVAIAEHCSASIGKNQKVSLFTRKTLRASAIIFGWYIKSIRRLTSKFKKFGTFINTRPFLTGAIIKAPLRLEFIIKNILAGDYIGAGAGLSWMILGDGGLALNDEKLKSALATYSVSRKVPAAGIYQ